MRRLDKISHGNYCQDSKNDDFDRTFWKSSVPWRRHYAIVFNIEQGWLYIRPFAILSLLFGGRSFSVHHLKWFFSNCHLMRHPCLHLKSNFNAYSLPLVEDPKKRGKFSAIICRSKFSSQFTIFFLSQSKPSMTMPLSNVVWYTVHYWWKAVAAIRTKLIWNIELRCCIVIWEGVTLQINCIL